MKNSGTQPLVIIDIPSSGYRIFRLKDYGYRVPEWATDARISIQPSGRKTMQPSGRALSGYAIHAAEGYAAWDGGTYTSVRSRGTSLDVTDRVLHEWMQHFQAVLWADDRRSRLLGTRMGRALLWAWDRRPVIRSARSMKAQSRKYMDLLGEVEILAQNR